MSLWNEIGYSRNPYGVDPLPPTAEGAALLVARDRELSRLVTELRSTDTHPTIEGENGVGKTSLVSVAVYTADQEFQAGRSRQLLLPLGEPFQLSDDVSAFERRINFAIARAYIDQARTIEDRGFFVPDVAEVRRWLDDPLLGGHGGGVSIMGIGGSASVTTAANTGAGFSEAGFRDTVRRWLRETFPTRENGAFVAVIDNLELLATSAEARRALESLRDEVLALPGIRWVLCGAKGIVRSAASSPRLSGRLGSPIDLQPVPESDLPELVRRRLSHFSTRADADPPIWPEEFGHLYRVSNKNLRNAFKHSQDFAVWLQTQGLLQASRAEKKAYLEAWMAEVADEFVRDAVLQAAQWRLFDAIAEVGGSIAPGDHEDFGFNTPQAMRFHLTRLEQANLIDSTIDESDQRRRTIAITSTGWLVRYRRSDFQEPTAG